ncbi:hypothetical protein K402DRAFT_190759 [Aulographum hederae CBS 113979]|uniref:Uncharacterized protein n=1 Tax=Aulographum hederae CBS 113979 TaxID=1176131 RepID=A0A6G1GNU6_9PEZI|nr:hypothetical protein K402DRAFT_190759 [Aulographum hederae CBS 113979]
MNKIVELFIQSPPRGSLLCAWASCWARSRSDSSEDALSSVKKSYVVGRVSGPQEDGVDCSTNSNDCHVLVSDGPCTLLQFPTHFEERPCSGRGIGL